MNRRSWFAALLSPLLLKSSMPPIKGDLRVKIALDTVDFDKQARLIRERLAHGWMTMNEARQRLGLQRTKEAA